MSERLGWGLIAMCWLIGLALVLPVYGCAGWPATRSAGIRRMAEAQLKFCLDGVQERMGFDEHCYEEARAYCVSQGLELDCGEGYQ